MKFLLALIALTSVAFAAEEIVLLDVPYNEVRSEIRFADSEESKFVIDFKTNEVAGTLSYYDLRQFCTGMGQHRDCHLDQRLLKSFSKTIEGLNYVEDKVIYNSQEGEVECGKTSRGRIFRNSVKLTLSGKCGLSSRIVTVGGEKRLQHVFSVK